MKTTKKITAVLLMILVLFTCIPMNVFAAESYSTEEKLSYSSNNVIGDTIVNAIDDTNQEVNDNGGNGVFGLSLDNLTANVALSAPDNSILLVAIYDEETDYMVTSGKTSVNSDTQTIEVPLAECDLPNYYIIKAFILNSDFSPVCNHYENKEYTKAYEAFFAQDIFDFDEEKVINFDAGYETNFAVVHDDSVVVSYSENENIVVTDDYENGIYVFENATEEITTLEYGDILYYVYGDGEEEYILTKVGTVETNGNLTTVTSANECEMSELFAYIDIDSSKLETPQTYGAEFDDEGGQLNEEKSYPITSGSKAKEFKGDNYSLKLSVSGDITFHIKFHYDFKWFGKDYYLFEYWVGVNANANATFNASGSFTKKCTMINTDIPIFYGIDVHVEVNLTISASASIEIKGDINFTMKNGASRESGGVQNKIEQKPTVEFNLDISGKYSISVTPELVIGFKIIKVFAVDMSVPVAVSTSGTLYVPTSNEELQKHTCKICVAGTSDVTVKLNITVKFLTKNIITVTPALKNIPLGNYYISLNNGINFGWGNCPRNSDGNSGSGGEIGDNTGNTGGNTSGGNGSGSGYNSSLLEEEIIKDITGTCGDNLIWTLYTDGELVISGKGEMYDYTGLNSSPWGKYIKKVTLGKDVTSIGNYAFYGNTWLQSIVLPDGLQEIGESAFGWCYGLEEVRIPQNVKKIGKNAFNYCSSLQKIVVHPYNNYYSSDEHGVLFNKDKTILMQYPSGNHLELYNIPEGVIEIEPWAFSYFGAYGVAMPSSVEKIGEYAFWDSFADKIELSEGLRIIDPYAFYRGNAAQGIIIPSTVTSIGEYAFSCSRVGSVNISSGITTIVDHMFEDCHNLKSVTLPESIVRIENSAFYDCPNLSNIEMPNNLMYLGEGAFSGCDSLTQFVVPEGITKLCKGTFSGCDNLTSVTIPKSVRNIEVGVFSSCKKLRTVNYTGPEEQWVAIFIDSNNAPLESATKVFNYVPESNIENSDEAQVSVANFSLLRSLVPVTVDYDAISKSKTITNADIGYGYLIVVVKNAKADDLLSSDNLLYIDQKIATDTTLSLEYTIPADTATHSVIVFSSYSILKPHEHEYIITERPVTCTQPGGTVYVCECGYTYMDNVIEATGHDYTVTSTEPTCTQKGEQIFTCRCGYSYTDEVSALGHDLGDFLQIKAPTCTEKGIEKSECSRCDYFETKDVPANKHNYKAVITPATCHSTGFTTNTCLACGDSYTSNPTNVIPHTIGDWYVMTPAGCESTGTKQRNCSECDYSETQEIPATGHDFDGSVCKNCNFDRADSCGCKCHKTGIISKIIWFITNFFNKLLKKNQVCDCGKVHF